MANETFTYEEKEILQLRCKEIEFIDDVSDFQCDRCRNVLITHFYANCGHVFCGNCKRIMDDGSRRWKCTSCQQFITRIDEQKVEFELKMKKLQVCCPNRKYGCQWRHTLSQLPKHLGKCEMTREASLPIEINPNEMILLNDLSQEVENLSEMRKEMEKLKEEIEKIKIAQSNLNEMRNLMEENTENMKSEMNTQLEKFNENLKLNQQQLPPPIVKQEKILPLPASEELKHLMSLVHVWKVQNIMAVFDRKPADSLSSVFPLTGYPFGAQVRLRLREDWVYMSLSFKDPSDGQQALTFKVIPRVSYVVKDQTGSELSKDRMRSISPLFNTSFSALKYDKFYYETVIDRQAKLKQPMYLNEGALVIEVHVEPPTMAEQVASCDGLLLSSINQYRRKRRMALEELVLNQDSPYFYTQPQGYKVLARMGLNGHEGFKGKGLSVSISFLTGEYDAQLIKFFEHRASVTLFNLKDPTRHLTKSLEQNIDKNLQYIIDVATNEEIEEFVENDVLYYKIEIKAL